MKNLEKLQKNHPELVKQYSEMNKDQLLEQICAEVLDLHDSIGRVQAFMNKCTYMSKTNYTIAVIEELADDFLRDQISEFCFDFLEDEEYTDSEIVEQIKKRAKLAPSNN